MADTSRVSRGKVEVNVTRLAVFEWGEGEGEEINLKHICICLYINISTCTTNAVISLVKTVLLTYLVSGEINQKYIVIKYNRHWLLIIIAHNLHFKCMEGAVSAIKKETYCFLNFCSTVGDGVPTTSWILEIWSSSLLPGKSGRKLMQ